MQDCLHCGNSSNNIFCCLGCKTAHNIIKSLNLSKYYEFCSKIYNTKPSTIINSMDNQLNYLEYVSLNGKNNEIQLLVEGIRCGSCIWLIENTLKQEANILKARINLSTKKIHLIWEGEPNFIKNIVSLIEKLGYKLLPFSINHLEQQRIENEKSLLKRLSIAGFIWIQNMMISMGIWAGDWNNDIGKYSKDFMNIISALITIPGICYAAMPFFISAFHSLMKKRSNMDVPISLATIITLLISVYGQLISSFAINNSVLLNNLSLENTYYEAASSLIFALLIGRYLEAKVSNKAYSYCNYLLLSQVSSVSIYNEQGNLSIIPIEKAKPGDIALVAAGEKIPVDGIIIDGESEIDNSIITGETIPVNVKVNSHVHAGTINLMQPLKIKVLKVAEDTVLSNIIKLVELAGQAKSKYVKLSDKASKLYTPIVFSLALITLIIWLLFIKVTFSVALLHASAVLIITCPCALGLAVPMVQIIACSELIKNGIMVKTSDALERINETNTIIFDKTGTLTVGKPILLNKQILSELNQEELAILLTLTSKSAHPLSKAIRKAIIELQPNCNMINKVEIYEERGEGIKAKLNNNIILLGKEKWVCSDYNHTTKTLLLREKEGAQYLETWFKYSEHKQAIRFIFSDEIRSGAIKVIKKLYNDGFNLLILSGDKQEIVKNFAQKVGIKNYYYELTPNEKYSFIKNLQKSSKGSNHKTLKANHALMIGDGLNDSAALKIAHSSISPSSAIEIAQSCADVVFQGSLYSILKVINTSKIAIKIMKENIILSLSYNLICIPIAMIGITNPAIAALTMSTSSIVVILNSMRIYRINKRLGCK